MQEGKVVCYESRKLNEREQNYPMHDLELVVIIHALNMWRHYILGMRFTLISDHNGLRYLFDQPNINFRKARWLATLNEFNFEIVYIKGKENQVVDALSRKVQGNNIATMSSYGTELQYWILQAQQRDEIIVDPRYRYMCRYKYTYSELKKIILSEFHAKPYSSHPRYQKTLMVMKKFYYFPNMKKEMVEIMARCLDCQQTERVNRILEDMFRMYVMHQQKKWEEYLPLVEFIYNNGYQESLRMSPFEALYERSCNTPISYIDPVNIVLIGPDMLGDMEKEMQVEQEGEVQSEPRCILQQKHLMLRKRDIEQVKVQWKHFGSKEATWEMADQMQALYPSLFVS
eukprot:PITA_25427